MIVLLVAANTVAFANSDVVNLDVDVNEQMKNDSLSVNLKEVNIDEDSTVLEGSIESQDSAQAAVPFVCAVKANHSITKGSNVYSASITTNISVQELNISADLQYGSPTGGSWITEVRNETVRGSGYQRSTPSYIKAASWGYWRCKATGSYYSPNVTPSANSTTDYSNSTYFE
ncbi:hypothetical protein [Desulforamulus aeronauticus]|uniref:hypothetical protein n=1 Tax=Desulforamulus aeronauticus TaxID=53343 RepID=UPI001114F379|nr:hypothetical protein [Desulforamulus aeronauticus]